MTKKAFRAERGLDAGGYKVVNVATVDGVTRSDAVNVDFFIRENTVQQHDKTRAYDKDFAVVFENRIWFAKQNIVANTEFDKNLWYAARVDPTWESINSTTAEGRQLSSGDFILAYSRNTELSFILPDNPLAGDTITIKDEGRFCHMSKIFVKSEKFLIGEKLNDLFSIPGMTKTFIFSTAGSAGGNGKWLVYNTIDGDPTEFATAASEFQLSSGLAVYQKSVSGRITLNLPKYANDKDVISVYDLDGNADVNGTMFKVATGSGQFIGKDGQSELLTNTTGLMNLIYEESTKIWKIYDDDIRSRWKPVRSDTQAQPMDLLSVLAPTDAGEIVITLPKDSKDGDFVRISNYYIEHDTTVKIKVTDGSDHKIIGNYDLMVYPKYKDIPNEIVDMPLVDEIVLLGDVIFGDKGVVFELAFDDTNKTWHITNVDTRIEHVDETNRERPGVAPLASQDEVNKNSEANPSDDSIVTPKTLANKTATETRRGIARLATSLELQTSTTQMESATGENLTKTIVTPKMLNSRQATEIIRGVAEVANQVEANTSTNDTHIITPKKLDARRATNTLAGVVKIGSTGGSPATSRSVPGDGVYNWSDAVHNEPYVVTPKTLNNTQATETSRGVAYIGTQSEVNGQGASASDAVIVTPKKLDTRRASETLAGIAEVATQPETDEGTLDTHIVTPKKLGDRRATESLHGLAEIATQTELNTGTLDTHIVTPLKFKTWMGYDHFNPVLASGIKRSGSIWNKVTLDIEKATETQRGTLEVANQDEADINTVGGGSDEHIITPKKLNARRASEELAGIAEIASTNEIKLGTDNSRIVSPKQFHDGIRGYQDFNMSESNFGTGKTATLGLTWVGNTTDGSTQLYDAYQHDPYVVSPKGLNYALKNYLPKTAKAVDSDKLDGLNSTQFLRSDQSDSMNGNLDITGTLNAYVEHTDKKRYGVRFIGSGDVGYLQAGCSTGSETDKHNMYLTGVTAKYLDQFKIYAKTSEVPVVKIENGTEYKIYHEGHKPTPAEINAYTKQESDSRFVNVTGDTITGQLRINSAESQLIIKETDSDQHEFRIGVNGNAFRINRMSEGSAIQVVEFSAVTGNSTFMNNVDIKGTINHKGIIIVESDSKINYDKLKAVPSATTSQKGIVQLSSAFDSTSTTTAATSSVIKVLKDIIDEKADITGSAMKDLVIENWLRIGNVILRPNKETKSLDFLWTDEAY